MRHHSTSRVIAAAFAIAGASLAMAQGAGTTTATTPGGAATATPAAKSASAASRLDRSDASFMKDAARAGMAEVESSKLAAQKATDPAIKSFAQKMVDDHTKAGDELKALAQSKGVELPGDVSMMQKGKLKMLSSADGAKFDKRYADSMGVKAHEDTVKLFQKAANGAKDPDVKAFAAKTLPTLQEHLKLARELHGTHSASSK